MPTTFVLIWTTIFAFDATGYPPSAAVATHSQEFNSLDTCQAARRVLMQGNYGKSKTAAHDRFKLMTRTV